MDESYHNALAAGIEEKYRALEMSIMDDIVRRIRKAGTITDAADWQIQRLVILGNSTQDIQDLIRKAVDGNEEEVRRLYAEVIEKEYTRDRALYEKIGKVDMAMGDVLVVDTNERHQIVELNGVNCYQKVDRASNPFQLDVGDNYLEYAADENYVNLDVNLYYTPKYLGV